MPMSIIQSLGFNGGDAVYLFLIGMGLLLGCCENAGNDKNLKN